MAVHQFVKVSGMNRREHACGDDSDIVEYLQSGGGRVLVDTEVNLRQGKDLRQSGSGDRQGMFSRKRDCWGLAQIPIAAPAATVLLDSSSASLRVWDLSSCKPPRAHSLELSTCGARVGEGARVVLTSEFPRKTPREVPSASGLEEALRAEPGTSGRP